MWDRIKAHLVDDWHRAYRFLSVQLAVLLVILEGAYDYLPTIQGYFPPHWQGIIGGAIILARIYQQTKRAKP
jgi:hypothetical protein